MNELKGLVVVPLKLLSQSHQRDSRYTAVVWSVPTDVSLNPVRLSIAFHSAGVCTQPSTPVLFW